MRRVNISGYVVYDEAELHYSGNGDGVAAHLESLLFNEEYPREWSITAVSDEEIEWDDED